MKYLVLVFVIYSSVFAQIDTTIWYPLQQGNYWEYYDASVQKGVTVLGDTTIDGKIYSILQTIDFSEPNNEVLTYRRLENNSFIFQRKGDVEILYYDFTYNEQNSWEIDSSYSRTFVKADSFWLDMFQINFLRMEYEDKYTAGVIEREWQQVSKGIGETLLGYSGGYIELVGAIINGVKYGSVTSVEKSTGISNSFMLNQNYPNPFNPSTTIKYSLPFVERKSSFAQTTDRIDKSQSGDWLYNVTLKVYDILGREVATLVNEQQQPGNYEVVFNAAHLASGTYYYRLTSGEFSDARKLLLLK